MSFFRVKKRHTIHISIVMVISYDIDFARLHISSLSAHTKNVTVTSRIQTQCQIKNLRNHQIRHSRNRWKRQTLYHSTHKHKHTRVYAYFHSLNSSTTIQRVVGSINGWRTNKHKLASVRSGIVDYTQGKKHTRLTRKHVVEFVEYFFFMI